MITKIFYSLVLFPKITYRKKLESGFELLEVRESGFGKMTAFFSDGKKQEEILFVHVDFVSENDCIKTSNWQISGKNKLLMNEVSELVKKDEHQDFNFFKDRFFYDKIPFGTVLSITNRCNLFCNYCFNEYDYPLKDRNFRKGMSLKQYKEIVDKLYAAGTRDIIITGGEPFTAGFLFDLLGYIKDKGIFIRINTNGTLLFKNTLDRLNNEFSLNLMVSMHEFNNKDYYMINVEGAENIHGVEGLKAFEDKFEKKSEILETLNSYPNLSLDFLTILTNKNIMNLEKIFEFVLSRFELENWHFFRLYSTNSCEGISRAMINLAIHKIYKLNKIHGTDFKIVDSVPFCVTKDTEISKQVIEGELSENHNVKTIINTDGNIQIMSAFDSNLGSIFENDILEVWNGEYVQKMLKNGFLPFECQDCIHKEECRGGSRMVANIANGSYQAFDPIGDINNKKTEWIGE